MTQPEVEGPGRAGGPIVLQIDGTGLLAQALGPAAWRQCFELAIQVAPSFVGGDERVADQPELELMALEAVVCPGGAAAPEARRAPIALGAQRLGQAGQGFIALRAHARVQRAGLAVELQLASIHHGPLPVEAQAGGREAAGSLGAGRVEQARHQAARPPLMLIGPRGNVAQHQRRRQREHLLRAQHPLQPAAAVDHLGAEARLLARAQKAGAAACVVLMQRVHRSASLSLRGHGRSAECVAQASGVGRALARPVQARAAIAHTAPRVHSQALRAALAHLAQHQIDGAGDGCSAGVGHRARPRARLACVGRPRPRVGSQDMGDRGC